MAILKLSNREHFHKHCRFSFQHFAVEFTHTFRCSFQYLTRISEGGKIGTWRQFAAARQCCEYQLSQTDEGRHFSSESPNFGPNKCSITLHCWLRISFSRLVACVESTSGCRHLLSVNEGTVNGYY